MRNLSKRRDEYIKDWLDNGKLKTNRNPQIYVREFLLKRQNDLCDICELPQEWNGRPLVFIIDHIDGNTKNSNESNLRMICSNCDSQLPTYKSKNKGKGREYDKKYRKEYYHRNK